MLVQCTCLLCGKPFLRKPSAVQRGGGKFCSLSCSTSFRNVLQTKSTADLFWPRVTKSELCWLATGGERRRRYTTTQIPKDGGGWKSIQMTHVAWWLATGHWPVPGEFMCHDCPGGDNTSCVRNDTIGVYEVAGITYEKRGHLWLGTHAANMADLTQKGRSRGAQVHNTSLTESKVREIRTRYSEGGITLAALGAEYDMTESGIHRIVKRRNWGHVV